MRHEYKIEMTFKDGTIKYRGYQELINQFGIGDLEFMGAPMKEGGTPQVQAFIQMIKRDFNKSADKMGGGLKTVTAYYHDCPILSV